MEGDFMNMKNDNIVSEIEVKERIKSGFSRSLANIEIKDDQDIFELGLVHSLFAMYLILFIEKEFGVELDDDEIDMEKLRTVNDIKTLVYLKLQKEDNV